MYRLETILDLGYKIVRKRTNFKNYLTPGRWYEPKLTTAAEQIGFLFKKVAFAWIKSSSNVKITIPDSLPSVNGLQNLLFQALPHLGFRVLLNVF